MQHGQKPAGNGSIVSLHLVGLSPTAWAGPGCWEWKGVFKGSHLDSLSWLIIEGGGLTLSVPPGQKLLVIQVTFSSTTCTYNAMREKAIWLSRDFPRPVSQIWKFTHRKAANLLLSFKMGKCRFTTSRTTTVPSQPDSWQHRDSTAFSFKDRQAAWEGSYGTYKSAVQCHKEIW